MSRDLLLSQPAEHRNFKNSAPYPQVAYSKCIQQTEGSPIFFKKKKQDLADNIEIYVASYIKLVDYYQNRLREVDSIFKESSSNYATDLIKSETFDQRCIQTCEKLYQASPMDYPLRTKFPPSHLTT